MNNNTFEAKNETYSADQVDLMPELSSHLYDDWMGQVVHHPYIIEKCYTPSMNGSLNERYKAIDTMLKEGFEQGDYNHTLIQEPYRLQILLENEKAIIDENKWWEYVREIYLHTEDINQYHQEYFDIFNGKYRKNVSMIMNEAELKFFSNLPDQVQVYRGCRNIGDNGFSYTLDKEIATWLSTRFEAKDAVVKERIVKKDVIACFFDTPGQEVIVLQ